VDAAQALGKVALDEIRRADSVALSAHKIRGPKGIGALLFSERARPEPLLLGGSQERGLRPGTADPVLAAGFRVALELASDGPERWARLGPLRDLLESELARSAEVNGAEPRLPHVSNLSFHGARGEVLVAALDLLGIRVSSGSACSAGSAEPSAVIAAMLGAERARSALRLSLGEDFDAGSLRAVVEAIRQVLASDRATR
jgi:cysteine desulfurase